LIIFEDNLIFKLTICLIVLMEDGFPTTLAEAIKILQNFVSQPDTYSRFEMAVREQIDNPQGQYKPYLKSVVEYAREVNQGASRFMGMGDLEIGILVDGTFPKPEAA
jgi:hypothetical protein